jgi:hypothetical protein
MKTKINFPHQNPQLSEILNLTIMKITKRTFAVSPIVLICLLLFLMAACQKDENGTEIKQAPQLPPEASMVMNFDDFADIDTTAYKSGLSFQNWGWSALNVGIWNAVIKVALAVPVAAFYESFNHEGIYNTETNKWIWSYNFIAGGAIHQASLHASIVPDGVHWQMYISKNNAFSNFLWYEGTTNTANSTAVWHLNEKPANLNEFLLIEYQKDLQSNIEQIKYTNVNPSSPGEGGYIQYGINNSLDYNAFYNIYHIEQDNMLNIEWSRTMKDGRVRDENRFGDLEWRCWDIDLQDIICQ